MAIHTSVTHSLRLWIRLISMGAALLFLNVAVAGGNDVQCCATCNGQYICEPASDICDGASWACFCDPNTGDYVLDCFYQ